MAQIQQQKPHQTNIFPSSEIPGESEKIDDLLQRIITLFDEMVGFTPCLVWRLNAGETNKLYSTDKASLTLETFLKLYGEIIENHQPRLSQGHPLIFPHTDNGISASLKQAIESYQIRSLLIIPLLHQQTYLGEFCFYDCQFEHRWIKQELKMICAFTTQCALTIYESQLLHKVQYQQWQQGLLTQINQKLNSNLNPPQIVREVLQLIGQNFQVEQVIIFHINGGSVQEIQLWQSGENLLSELIITPDTKQWSDTLLFQSGEGASQFCSYYPESENLFRLPTCSFLSVPIFIREQFFGYLILQTTQYTRLFTSEEMLICEGLAESIAIALFYLQNQECLQQLEEENQRLKASVQVKSDYFSNMNHELRTPLAGVLGFARMLREEIYGSLNAKQRQYVSGIVTSGEHLLELVNDFLDLSKIEANREELFLEMVAVEDVCLAAMSMIQARAKEQKLELRLEIDVNIGCCIIDQRRIKQILLNLLSNALKFTEAGSVILQVKSEPNWLLFSVIDTGIGIKESDQKKLFQPFQQIANSLSRKHKGSGLGLALSRKLAQLHGGDLTLSSTEGKGSCFTLQLPIRD